MSLSRTTCQICGKPTNIFCSRCRKVYYCGAEHQKADWKIHKRICNSQGKRDSKKEEATTDRPEAFEIISNESKHEILERIYGLCPECKSIRHDYVYCQKKDCEYRDITNLRTSGNKNLDDFMRETLLDPTTPSQFRSYLRWIPYERLANIQQIEESDYAIVYKATWLDCYTLVGYLSRGRVTHTIILKRLKNSQNMSEYFLNDIKTYWRYSIKRHEGSYLELHGITQDPKTKEYLIVMDYGTRGDLKNHLKRFLHEVLWGNIVAYLYDLSRQLYGIHKTGTVHCNLHSGNIVISNISFSIIDSERHAYFIGFRHSCPENTTVSDVYGVLPYVAPEILRKQPYTTATDIYSFGVVMCELASGEPPYPDRPHNTDLALDIIQGLHPKIAEEAPQCYVDLAKRCLDIDPHKRPSAEELNEIIAKWWIDYNNYYEYYDDDRECSEICQQFSKANELLLNVARNPITELHPEAIYNSKPLNDIIEAVNLRLEEIEPVLRDSTPILSRDINEPANSIKPDSIESDNVISDNIKPNMRDNEFSQSIKNIQTQNMAIYNPIRKNQLDKKFVGIIVKDNQPLSIRDGKGFQEFVRVLDPSYELPSDKKVKELLIDGYNYCKQEIMCLFEQGIASYSLTLDLWTSRRQIRYLNVTCIFITNQFELREVILATKYLKYPYTSDVIVECLNQIIQEWKLNGKVFTISTDNEINMVKTGKLLENNNIMRFPCATHTLQLVVGKGLLPAEKLVARAKRLISFFTTPQQTERLIEVQKNMKHNQQEDLSENDHYLRLISNLNIWNSSYLAWKRLEKIHDYIDVMLMNMSRDPDPTIQKDGKRLSKINLTEDEWLMIKELTKVLEPFAAITELLKSNKFATISFINNAITVIKNRIFSTNEIELDLTNPTIAFDDNIGIEDLDDDDDYPKQQNISVNTPQDCNNLIGKVKSALYMAINHYWNVSQDEGMIASFLDPRCKSLSFATESQKNKTKALLRRIYNEKKQEIDIIQQQKQLQVPDDSLLKNIFASHYHHETEDEIEEYMMIEEINMNACPFKWWAFQESKFSVLSQLAKKYLAIPAVSTSSERLFSNADNIMTDLLPSTFEHLVFCKQNLNLIDRIFPDNSN